MRLLCVSLLTGLCWAGSNAGPLASQVAGEIRRPAQAPHIGVWLVTQQDRLIVARATGSWAALGLRSGDQVVAVNGRRVATERAFLGRVRAAIHTGTPADILVSRRGAAVHIVAAGNHPTATRSAAATTPASSSTRPIGRGVLNPDNMVITKDGRIMHKDAAARLGVEVLRPLDGSTAPPGAVN